MSWKLYFIYDVGHCWLVINEFCGFMHIGSWTRLWSSVLLNDKKFNHSNEKNLNKEENYRNLGFWIDDAFIMSLESLSSFDGVKNSIKSIKSWVKIRRHIKHIFTTFFANKNLKNHKSSLKGTLKVQKARFNRKLTNKRIMVYINCGYL